MKKSQENRARDLAMPVDLQGVDRVTALLLVMGKPHARRIIKQFEDRDIRALARSAHGLPAVDLDVVEKLVEQLVRQCEKGGNTIVGSLQEAQRLLTGVVSDEEVSDIMGEIAGQPPKRIWGRLSGVSDEKLGAFIAREEPQVAAFILSNLETDKASKVMERLDAQLRADLSASLLHLRPISDWAARMVGDQLEREMFGVVADPVETNKHMRVGTILNKLEPTQITDILDRLEQSHPDDTRKIRKYIFIFDNVVELSPDDRSRLFGEVPAERIILALRDAAPELQVSVLSVLSPRSRRLVEAELSIEVKVSRKSILDARRAIADLALALAEKSTINLTLPEAIPNADESAQVNSAKA